MSDPPPRPGDSGRMSFVDFSREFVSILRAENAPKTARRAERELGRIAALGVRWIDEVKRPHIAAWCESLRELQGNTLKSYFSALRTAFDYAVECGYLERNPCRAKPPKFSSWKRPRKRHLSVAEVEALFPALRDEAEHGWKERRLYTLALTIFGTGMRPAEGQRLRWVDVDLAAGLVDLSGERRKTDESRNQVAMPDFVVEAMEDWYPLCGSPWVFPHTGLDGPWLNGATGRRPVERLQQAARRAGVGHVTFSMLRHTWTTFAETRWNLTGKHIRIQLRHTTEKTQEHYGHSNAVMMRSVIKNLPFPGARLEAKNRGEKRSDSA